MSTTAAAGPPAAGPPLPQAAGGSPGAARKQGTADPALLLQGQRAAECELADALARFQSEVTPAAEMSLPAVVEAARGAFRLGFAYTACRGLDEDGRPLLEVTVMHRGGEQISSQVRLDGGSPEQEFTEAARLLAQLLGIPVLSAHEQAQPRKAEPLQAHVVQERPSLPPAEAAPSTPSPQASSALASALASALPSDPPPAPGTASPAADPIGPGSPDAPATEEGLRPLGEEERRTLLEMIRSLRPVEARRQFQIAFRHHFNVPREARSIAGFITQQRHRDFVDRFERELADLPAATALPQGEEP